MTPRAWRIALIALLALGVLAAAGLVAAALSFGELPHHIATVTIDGETIDLQGLHGGDWFVVAIAVLIGLLIAIIVVPMALLFGIGAALVVVGAVFAVMLSPLLLVGLGAWWLWKRSARPARPTTIAP